VDFNIEIEEAVFLDPARDFQETRVPLERRKDPLTGRSAWVIPNRLRFPEPIDLEQLMARSRRAPCPFCPENAELTPKFPPSLIEEGRLRRRQALVVPNLFPYEPLSAVVRLSETHFVPMDGFNVEWLLDGILLSLEYIDRVRKAKPEVRYASVNCNYMPPAGSGLVHPHFQTVASPVPTRYVDQVAQATAAYFKWKGSSFWGDYIREEERRGERFIGRIGKVAFLAPFASTNMMGEVMAIFEGQRTPWEDPEGYGSSFCDGLARVLGSWKGLQLMSFNMAVYFFLAPSESNWTFARIAPRCVFPLVDRCDVNYYDKLHGEAFCIFPPEEMCSRLRPEFAPGNP
jgi:UDPglucose--hexose-1-phosphate uridylyltransferase